MTRTPLGTWLQHAASVAAEAASRDIDTGQVIAERTERWMSRRDVLRLAGATGLAAGLSALPPRPAADAAGDPSIVVVGAGLAGLPCAYRLKQAGYTAAVYEAADRIGGRCWSIRGAFDDGQIAEHGGELIDQGHTAIRQLAQELGLMLDNLLAAEVNGTEPCYHFDGAPYPFAAATDDLKGIYQTLHRDVSGASYPTLYNNYTQRGFQLDRLSVRDWINQYVPGGIASRLGQLLDVAYDIEYGAETSVQSSLNMLYLLGYSGQGQLRIFGPFNEKYHVRGGNDPIVQRLANMLTGQIQLASALVAIKQNANNTYDLTFQAGLTVKTVTADRVVLALPLSILRSSVDCKNAGFKPVKQTAIKELGMGTNSKLHVQLYDRQWNSRGCNGETFPDTGHQNTWEVSRAQPGTAGILVNYTGGKVGASFGTGTPQERARQLLTQLESVLPGISAKWNQRATVDFCLPIHGPRAPTPTGRLGSAPSSPGLSASGRAALATAHLPANTRRSTSRPI